MSSNAWIVVVIAAVVVGIAITITTRRRSTQNSVDSFRRQIDALGPAARRTVVDQVQQNAANRDLDGDVTARPDDPADAPDEDGTRGT
jgi:hypothetical protein